VVERDGGGEALFDYDHLLIATGPKLDFERTEGLGPEGGDSQSICTGPHAVRARDAYLEEVARMAKGERRLVIGTGHPGATCRGAAFEYITNVHKDLVRRGVRDKADLLWLSNEQALGDFGVCGVAVRRKGRSLPSEEFISAVFTEYGIRSQVRTVVLGLSGDAIAWEDFEGAKGETGFDFSMLLPRFLGQPPAFADRDGAGVSGDILAPNGPIKVDATYGPPCDELTQRPDARPRVCQNPAHPEIFAAGIAFAPPGPVSVPHATSNGTAIAAAPPRTGMVSGSIGRVVALNSIDLVREGTMTHGERTTEMYAACIAAMGDSLWDGSAVVIMIYLVVPDRQRYSNDQGRDLFVTHREVGLAGAWLKRMIQTTFMHKLRGRIGRRFIPE
jgi:sulfide:quinone oxidoreductase